MPISIVVADDHPVVRRGLRALLDAEPDFRVTAEAGDAAETVRVVQRLRPDVLVLDLALPGSSGLEVLRAVRERAPDTRVLVFTMHANTAFVAAALGHGATGYAVKGCADESVVRAVRETAEGRRFLNPPVAQRDLDAHLAQSGPGRLEAHDTLTPRELEVLRLVAGGQTSRQIAERLHISPRTVENHRANLMQKLSLDSRSELIRHALRFGLIPLDG